MFLVMKPNQRIGSLGCGNVDEHPNLRSYPANYSTMTKVDGFYVCKVCGIKTKKKRGGRNKSNCPAGCAIHHRNWRDVYVPGNERIILKYLEYQNADGEISGEISEILKFED